MSMWSTELFVLTMCRVPAADAKISQVWFLKDPCQTFTLVNRKLLTRRSICPTSLLKLEMGSIDIVSVCVYESAHNLIFVSDWAYLEDWCRRLTGKFQDVYVFTVPLYLPKRDPDGKWRVVCTMSHICSRS